LEEIFEREEAALVGKENLTWNSVH
jgi:hypothetical protein